MPYGDLAVAHARERERADSFNAGEPPSFDSVASPDVSPSRQLEDDDVELEGSGRELHPVGEESHPSRPVSIRVVSASTVQTFETAREPEHERDTGTPTPEAGSSSDPSVRPTSPMTLTPPPTPPRTAVPLSAESGVSHKVEAALPSIVVDTSA